MTVTFILSFNMSGGREGVSGCNDTKPCSMSVRSGFMSFSLKVEKRGKSSTSVPEITSAHGRKYFKKGKNLKPKNRGMKDPGPGTQDGLKALNPFTSQG